MKTYILVRSEYSEHDSSRYRLGITQNTLIQSLKYQGCKRAVVALKVSPMDPFWCRRVESFDECGFDVHLYPVDPQTGEALRLETPRIEIHVGDDDFLCPNLIRMAYQFPFPAEDTCYTFPCGYLFHEKKLTRMFNEQCVRMIYKATTGPLASQIPMVIGTKHPTWIKVRHQLNYSLPPSNFGPEMPDPKWQGWSPAIVGRIASTTILTGSAMGCQLHPTRSNSVVRPHRFKKRGKRV